MRARRPLAPPAPAPPGRPTAHERFRRLDDYRVQREWDRYEGTAQRDLFRELRERFLGRWAQRAGWTLEVGPGPGRFSALVGSDARRRVALDLSEQALRTLSAQWTAHGRAPPAPHTLRGDAGSPPVKPSTFSVVSLLGNVLGFAGDAGPSVLAHSAELAQPGGHLLLEVDCGPGERSRYLGRLPPGAVRRLLASPPGLVLPRIRREGFRRAVEDEAPRGLRRVVLAALGRQLQELGFEVVEALAVAPALGMDAARVAAVRPDPKAWSALLQTEEELGREPARLRWSPAVLLCARRSQAHH